MVAEKYKLSFTAGGLLYWESIRIAEVYECARDWDAVIQKAHDDNLLQARKTSTDKRKVREICTRLRLLTDDQLQLLLTGTRREQLQILWLAACKRYRFLHDFGEQVLHNKFLAMDLTIDRGDFDTFLENTSVWQEEIDTLTESTRRKLRQVALRMLREADLISRDGVIQPTILSPELIKAIRADSVSHFLIYPVTETDVGGIAP